MNGKDFYDRHGRGPTLTERLEAETDLGELDGLIAARERTARILSAPRMLPTAEELAVYKARRRALIEARAAE
jgi:hypothetical protein